MLLFNGDAEHVTMPTVMARKIIPYYMCETNQPTHFTHEFHISRAERKTSVSQMVVFPQT